LNKLKAISAAVIICLLFCHFFTHAQGTTNQGKEFWTGFMAHNLPAGANGSQMALYITSDFNTTGKIEIADGSFDESFNVTAGKVTIINIPASAFLERSGKFLKGIHITAQKRIAVYAHIYAQSVSGATLLLPVRVLGKSYYSINYVQQANVNNAYSTFMVIATEDNTTVEIKPATQLVGRPDVTAFTITLRKGEIYQGFAQSDLTGTTIKSISTSSGDCKRIAVFSGSTRLSIGCDPDNRDFSSDNLFQQMYPTSSWGKNYLTVPLKNRSYDIFRVMLSDVNTQLEVNGKRIDNGSFDDPRFYEFTSQEANYISADKPVQVVQYAVTQGRTLAEDCSRKMDDIGDPEMIYLTPLEQTLDHVTLYSSRSYRILDHYVNVVIKTGAVNSFLIDGKPYKDFIPLAFDPAYSYAQIDIGAGTHAMSAADGFNAIAYGFGNAESYGYAAGANLKNLNENIVLVDAHNTAKTQIGGCAGIEYKPQLTLAYQVTTIKWKFSDGSAPVTDNNPVVKSSVIKDGKTLYTYDYKDVVKYTAGDYSITATVPSQTVDECGSTTDIDFDFNIADYPEAKFSFAGACAGEATQFTDITDAANASIKSWHWDFGDGQTSAEQNPIHNYLTKGSYKVVLTLENENACSATATNTINIVSRPVAAFDFKTAGCIGKPVTIADASISTDGPIKQWIWDFSDGVVETYSDNKPFTHIFTQSGTYPVKLTLVTESGCTVVTEKSIEVSPLPIVDFAIPDVCVADAFAQFLDKSTIDNNIQTNFKYAWDFGDANASAANSNSSNLKDPKHKYTQAGIYNVTLTVIQGNGCPQSKTIQFTVNGSTPKAKFTVADANSLCSANAVVIQDQSTVDFGRITKIVIYYDLVNHPELFEEFGKVDMAADGKYRHVYDLSTTAKIYTIRLKAYSGGVCESITEQQIEVKGNPQVLLNPVAPICVNDEPVQVLANNNGFTGTGTFTGTEISSSGLFNPKQAGVGTFTITYHFLAANGCDAEVSQQLTVNAIPGVNAGTDFTMLEDQSATLNASAKGVGLTYKWTPSAGLDHDDVLKPMASPVSDITYKLTVTNAAGCSFSDEVFVTVLRKPIVVNTFTPNGDGINDLWNIKYLDNYPGSTVDIYNRNGEKVYSSVGYAYPWDGRHKGAALPTGTYYYIINPKNGRKPVSGNVTIIK
jgi:gliding motility-associated-like protein